MYDCYNRKINYLRISVTDRCNLRCDYCMPAQGIQLLNHNDILRFEEILEFTKIAVNKGIDKVRITGGEPLVRKGIVNFVQQLSQINGIKDISMTTNGILLEEFAKPLKEAGLQRVNISLDSTDPIHFSKLTRGGDVTKVFRGIDAAKNNNLLPVKINCVINESPDEPDAVKVKDFCEKQNIQIRFIYRMNLLKGHFGVVEGGNGGDCSICNRLRLSSNGKLRPCLFNDTAIDIREHGYEKSIDMALALKPEYGTFSKKNIFNEIGG